MTSKCFIVSMPTDVKVWTNHLETQQVFTVLKEVISSLQSSVVR